MIRVSGTGASAPTAPSRKASKSAAGFRVDGGSKPASAPAQAGPATPVETLSALIALQGGEGDAKRNRSKTIAAAQRALDLLDRVRAGLLEGTVSNEDLDALAQSAASSASAMEVDEGLAALYDEISLRARVELAKRGR